VSPIKCVRGELCLPGDKSISHRAAIIAALAHGKSVLSNFSSAQDCQATLACLKQLGVDIFQDGSTVTIAPPDGLRSPQQVLNAQNSGTTMRLLAGVLAGQPFESTITGDESLLRRPMARVAEPLRMMSADITLESDGCGPMRIRGRRPLRAIDYRLPVASAQIKSALLLAGLFADGATTIEEPQATRDHTERMLAQFGCLVERDGQKLRVKGAQQLHAAQLSIPGDISSAAFFIAAAIALPGSDLTIKAVGLNPTRTQFVETIKTLGVEVVVSEERVENGEPVGSLRIHSTKFKPKDLQIAGAAVPGLIDELPLLAFLCAGLGCGMELKDARELRVKESDRINATVENLTRMGAKIVAREDGWVLENSATTLRGARLDSYGDHRIAMSCAVAALTADGTSEIIGAREAVAVSLPEFWTLLDGITR
jgi:3-phosphoshikimate 1-carboxyvinyltransferase